MLACVIIILTFATENFKFTYDLTYISKLEEKMGQPIQQHSHDLNHTSYILFHHMYSILVLFVMLYMLILNETSNSHLLTFILHIHSYCIF